LRDKRGKGALCRNKGNKRGTKHVNGKKTQAENQGKKKGKKALTWTLIKGSDPFQAETAKRRPRRIGQARKERKQWGL